jgi:transcriptional regulator with XRE-family HTH domain
MLVILYFASQLGAGGLEVQLTRLKEWREAKGLMQKELAAAAGMSEFTVVRAERGDSLRPSTARKVAEALDITVADLLERPPVPLAEAPKETGRLEGEQLEADSPKDRQHWERVLASVRQRQREVEAKVEELVALPVPSEADPYQVKWVLDEAQDCWHTLMLALPGSRREQDKIVLEFDLFSIDPAQWEQSGTAERFYYDLGEKLEEAGLVELRERTGQKAEPVPLGIGV